MTDWTTNSKGGTVQKPCPTGGLGVFICGRDDVNSWGQRLEELESAIKAEAIPFGQWFSAQENGTEGAGIGRGIVSRYADWTLRGQKLTRSSVTGIGAPQQVRALADHVQEGAAILESMKTKKEVFAENMADQSSRWVTVAVIGGAVVIGGALLWSALR